MAKVSFTQQIRLQLHQILLLLLFITTTTTQSINCTPTQVHITIGDAYYWSMYNFSNITTKNNTLTLIYHTEGNCSNTFIRFYGPSNNFEDFNPDQSNSFCFNYTDGNYNTQIQILFIDERMEKLQNKGNFVYAVFGNLEDNPMQIQILAFFQRKNILCRGNFTVKSPLFQKITAQDEINIPQKYIFTGDMDSLENGNLTINAISALSNSFQNYQAYIHVGDLAYNLESNGGKVGDSFLNAIQNITANIPYIVTPGNHESFYNYTNFNNRFQMPLYEQMQNHFYSYNIGLVHFISWDFDFFTHASYLNNITLQWIENDLEMANSFRNTTLPWIIAINHRPLYCNGVKGACDCKLNAKQYPQFDDLLQKYKVDLFINGHIHYYERMLPMHDWNLGDWETPQNQSLNNYFLNPTATISIVEGIAGNNESVDQSIIDPKNSVIINNVTGYGVLTVWNSSVVEYTHYSSTTGAVIDDFILQKNVSIQMKTPWVTSSYKSIIIILIICSCLLLFFIAPYYCYRKYKQRSKKITSEIALDIERSEVKLK